MSADKPERLTDEQFLESINQYRHTTAPIWVHTDLFTRLQHALLREETANQKLAVAREAIATAHSMLPQYSGSTIENMELMTGGLFAVLKAALSKIKEGA